MARLTKVDIERELLSGKSIEWNDANNAKHKLVLDNPMDRRLFAFVLSSGVRLPTGLSTEFIDGLSSSTKRE